MGRVAIIPLTKPIRGVPVGGILEVPARDARVLVALNRACYAQLPDHPGDLPAGELRTTALTGPDEPSALEARAESDPATEETAPARRRRRKPEVEK